MENNREQRTFPLLHQPLDGTAHEERMLFYHTSEGFAELEPNFAPPQSFPSLHDKHSHSHSMADFSVCVLGPGAVGKSCLTIQFTSQVFVEDYDPTISDVFRTHVSLDGVAYFAQIQDTAGQDVYRSMVDVVMAESDAFLVVFDLTDMHSLEECEEILERLFILQDSETIETPSKPSKTPLRALLIGNKSDLPPERRQVSWECVEKLSKKWNIQYVETSALENSNVSLAFEEASRLAVAHRQWKSENLSAQRKQTSTCQKQRQKQKKSCILL